MCNNADLTNGTGNWPVNLSWSVVWSKANALSLPSTQSDNAMAERIKRTKLRLRWYRLWYRLWSGDMSKMHRPSLVKITAMAKSNGIYSPLFAATYILMIQYWLIFPTNEFKLAASSEGTKQILAVHGQPQHPQFGLCMTDSLLKAKIYSSCVNRVGFKRVLWNRCGHL